MGIEHRAFLLFFFFIKFLINLNVFVNHGREDKRKEEGYSFVSHSSSSLSFRIRKIDSLYHSLCDAFLLPFDCLNKQLNSLNCELSITS